jgi:hypothetical protein
MPAALTKQLPLRGIRPGRRTRRDRYTDRHLHARRIDLLAYLTDVFQKSPPFCTAASTNCSRRTAATRAADTTAAAPVAN